MNDDDVMIDVQKSLDSYLLGWCFPKQIAGTTKRDRPQLIVTPGMAELVVPASGLLAKKNGGFNVRLG